MPTFATWRRRSYNCCLELFGSELFVQYFWSCSFPLRELEPVHWVTRSGSRFIMFGAVRPRAVRAAWCELFVHSGRIRAATQEAYMLTLCHILCCFNTSWNISLCVQAVCKTARYICVCSNNHFGTNPVHLIIWNVVEPSSNEMLRSRPQMKCCGAVLKWND